MSILFRKRIRIAKGLNLNISKSGVGVNVGAKGANITAGKRGTSANLGLPGTGIYSRTTIKSSAKEATAEAAPQKQAPKGCVLIAFLLLMTPIALLIWFLFTMITYN